MLRAAAALLLCITGATARPSPLALHAVRDVTRGGAGDAKIAPVFAKLAEDVPEALFVKVDVDEVPDASAHFGVQALPTFLLLKDGKEVARFQGANEPELRRQLELNGCPPPKNDIF
ncbi:hypothetical protein JL721_10943 [Aureococcus anophagefferens]|nr:hypothetical protein JL721_10943 [Aureococcus anophagefferens]